MRKSYIPRILLVIFFVALLATPLALRHFYRSQAHEGADPTTAREAALRRYGFHLEEISQAAGINFVHTAPKLDPKLDHIMPQVASMGASISVVDFDRDGWQDLYITNSGEGSLNALYRNNGDGTFTDVAAKMGVADVNSDNGVSMGAVWGDYDNDGYEDLLVYKWGRPELFRNNDGRSFTRVTDEVNLPIWVNANTAVWFDFDRDGHLDIFLGGYYAEDVNLWNLKTTRMMPESFEYARNGGRKYLLRNRGDGTFEDVTARVGIDTRRWALAAVAADLRGTGYPDLFIANDYGVSELFFNEKGERFRDVGERTGVGFAPKSGMNAALGDILNQGKFAIYVTNISEEGVLLQGNNLWMPRDGTSGDGLKYDNLARVMGVEHGGWSFGAHFGDLNNDGTLDLYLTNGYISLARGTNYWYDFTKIAGGNSTIIADAANWPPMHNRSLSGFQQKRVWINDGAGKFTDVAQAVGARDRLDGRAVALADLWNRGVLDVVVANQRGPVLVYKNTVEAENKWIVLDLEATTSNRSAIGAQVRVFWNGKQQVQEVSGGSGFCSQNQRPLHFGLGRNASVERIEIRWPSGRVQTIEKPELNKIHRIKES
ncbi:MAG TPA: CRTAC1 family protein [Pyrinomonadaceae bacterium]|nr:CRTAC1 family protein [Pyrinomonadaceae bacterium]